MLVGTVSYDSWPSATWRGIIDERMDEYAGLSPEEFEALLTRQLAITVETEGPMAGEVPDAYLAPHRSALGRASSFEHQVRHCDSTYTEEITDRLGEPTMPVRVLWGEHDRWQPLGYAERLRRDIPRAELVVVPGAGHFVMEDARNGLHARSSSCWPSRSGTRESDPVAGANPCRGATS